MAPASSTEGERDDPWTQTSLPRRRFSASASLILIGVLGAGKRTLGFIAATHLKRRLCTESHQFEKATGLSKASFLDRYGREAFLARNLQVLEEMLEQNSRNCVIECGANSLTPGARQVLTTYISTHPVVHILRPFDDILLHRHLPFTDAEQLRRVDAGHRSCSNFEFFNLYDSTTAASDDWESADDTTVHSSPLILQKVKLDFCSFLDRILADALVRRPDPFDQSKVRITTKRRSFVNVCLVSSLVNEPSSVTGQINGADAIELRVDEWQSRTNDEISQYVSALRRHHRASIILSVDDKAPGMTAAKYWLTIAHGLRLGFDGIAINGFAPADLQKSLLAGKGSTVAIAHFDFGSGNAPHAWHHSDRLECYNKAQEFGYDLVSQIQLASNRSDNEHLEKFRQDIEYDQQRHLPLIAFNTGRFGRTSKLRNARLTPVVSESVPFERSADIRDGGHLTVKDITQALFSSFQYDPLQFFVFASSSVEFSRSPAMYKAAFEMYGMSHSMAYQNARSLEELVGWTKQHTFGGAAISFPFKEAILGACAQISHDAAIIGSANSIIPLRDLATGNAFDMHAQAAERNRQGPVIGLYGHNTDWLGFYRNLRRHISPRNAVFKVGNNALVLGAGGSARAAIYALILMGYKSIYVRNRTKSKALQLAADFDAWCKMNEYETTAITTLDDEESQWPPNTSLPTVIIACVPTDEGFHLPDDWLGSLTGGVVAEVGLR